MNEFVCSLFVCLFMSQQQQQQQQQLSTIYSDFLSSLNIWFDTDNIFMLYLCKQTNKIQTKTFLSNIWKKLTLRSTGLSGSTS